MNHPDLRTLFGPTRAAFSALLYGFASAILFLPFFALCVLALLAYAAFTGFVDKTTVGRYATDPLS